MKTAQLIDFL